MHPKRKPYPLLIGVVLILGFFGLFQENASVSNPIREKIDIQDLFGEIEVSRAPITKNFEKNDQTPKKQQQQQVEVKEIKNDDILETEEKKEEDPSLLFHPTPLKISHEKEIQQDEVEDDEEEEEKEKVINTNHEDEDFSKSRSRLQAEIDRDMKYAIEDEKYQEEEEEFEVPITSIKLERNGCPFGWFSRSKQSKICYHVSLIVLEVSDAANACSDFASNNGLRKGFLATIPTEQDNIYLCDTLNRANSRFLIPDKMHIGLFKEKDGLVWRDGTKFELNEFAPFVSTKSISSSKILTLTCSGKYSLKWTVESNSALPYACSAEKPNQDFVFQNEESAFELDSIKNERLNSDSANWITIPEYDKRTKNSCKNLIKESPFNHKSPALASLETQIYWKLSDRVTRMEPKRYFAIWQSKGWFGWLEFWVEYLKKYRDFHGAPVGKFVTSSRAAREHLGFSNIFGNPSIAQKYGGSLCVLSRLPIPEHVLVYFPQGTLVNQVYTDPLGRYPLGDKLELVEALAKYSLEMNCHDASDLLVMPETYDLSNEYGCQAALKVLRKRISNEKDDSVWVIKGPQHGGAAITLGSPKDIENRIKTCSKSVYDAHEIVQRVVTNPMLLDGRKFDVRVFVLIASTKPLLVFVHREPYYRATIRKFDSSTTSIDKSRHVTNTHVQKAVNFTEKDWAEHIWTPEKVRTYATRANIPVDFWETLVFPKIKRAIQIALKAAGHSITQRRSGQWKLFGVDFVIDSNYQPFLVDWNAFPGWDWSYRIPWALDYRRRILGDTWRLVLDVQRGKALTHKRATPKSGGFELVFHSEPSII